MTPFQTKAFIVVITVALILVDLYLATDDKKGNTYSEVLRGWFKSMTWLFLLVSFALGVLMGHWAPKLLADSDVEAPSDTPSAEAKP